MVITFTTTAPALALLTVEGSRPSRPSCPSRPSRETNSCSIYINVSWSYFEQKYIFNIFSPLYWLSALLITKTYFQYIFFVLFIILKGQSYLLYVAMKSSSWKRYISFDFQTMLLLRIEHSSSFTAKTDKLSRIPNLLAPGSMIEWRAACKALPLLGVLICPWVSSPCVTSVPEEIIPHRMHRITHNSCKISLHSMWKIFLHKTRRISLHTMWRISAQLWALVSFLIGVVRPLEKMGWKQQEQHNSRLHAIVTQCKKSCYEKSSWAMNNHNCWSCYRVMDRNQFQHLDGEASGICRSWLSPMVDPLRLLEVVNISLVPSNNSSSLFNPTFNSLSSSFCSSQRSFASWLFVDISILTKM